MERAAKKRILYLVLKSFVSGLFLFIVFRKAGVSEVVSHLTSIKPAYFFLSSFLYLVASYLSATRWRMFLNENYPIGRLFSLYFIGIFFNNVLPGIVGGDAVKIYYLHSDTRKVDSSLGSVFMDRYVGFFALLCLGLISGLLSFHTMKGLGMHWVMPLLFIFFIAGSLAFFGLRIGKRFSVLSDFYSYFHSYLKDKQVMRNTFILSIIIQIIGIVMVYIIALGLEQTVSFPLLLVFMPIIITIASVPISISGFGIREGAFVVLFGLIGIPPHVAASISFLWFLSIACASLIGLIEYMRYKKKIYH